MKKHAEIEKRKYTNLAGLIFEWGFAVYERAGSYVELTRVKLDVPGEDKGNKK